MNTILIKQKLHDYIETASDETLEALYQEVMEDNNKVEWDDEFAAEMEMRMQSYLDGNATTVSLSDALDHAKKAVQKARTNGISH